MIERDSIRVAGVAAYRRGDSEELLLEIEILAEYRDALIVRLSDLYPPENGERMRSWMRRWGGDLNPSYV